MTRVIATVADQSLGKVVRMPRRTMPMPPKERFTLPEVREAWAKLQPITLMKAVEELWITIDVLKHRRHDAETGEFPAPIPIQGGWRQSSMLYDRRLMELWYSSIGNIPRLADIYDPDIRPTYDLRLAPAELVAEISGEIDQVVAVVEPILLTAAAEAMVVELAGITTKKATAAVERYRKTWEQTGRKPEVVPAEVLLAQRRLKQARERWTQNGFPPPLPADAADVKTGEMIFSMPELRAWMASRSPG